MFCATQGLGKGVLIENGMSEGQREYETAQLQGEINADKIEIKRSEELLKHMTNILSNKEPMSVIINGPDKEANRARHYSNLVDEYKMRSECECQHFHSCCSLNWSMGIECSSRSHMNAHTWRTKGSQLYCTNDSHA